MMCFSSLLSLVSYLCRAINTGLSISSPVVNIIKFFSFKFFSFFQTAGNCFALLPSIGGGGVGGVLYKEAWSFYMKKLLNTLKDLFSKLYKDHDSGEE